MRKQRRGWNLDWSTVLLTAIFMWFSYTFIVQQIHLNAVADEQIEAKKRLDAAQIRNQALKAERNSLHDAIYIEKVARETLGMTREGEMPYIATRR